jgi:hypothetical protein
MYEDTPERAIEADTPERETHHANGTAGASARAGVDQQAAQEADTGFPMLRSVVSLLLGATQEGSDVLAQHLRQWDHTVGWAQEERREEVQAHLLWYALLGMMLEGQERARRRLASIWRFSEDAAYVLSAPLRLATGLLSDPRQPRRSTTGRNRWQADLDRWIAIGREAEVHGRLLVREAAGSGFEELLDFLAHRPEIREFIEQQGLGVADTAVEEARRRTASADTRVEQLVRAWFRRPPNSRPPEPGTSSEAGP